MGSQITRRSWLIGGGSLCALAASGLAACASPPPLRLGLHPWPGYEPLALAQDFGWLPTTVQLQHGASASDTMFGLRNGRLDGGCLTLDEVLLLRSEGLPLAVLAVLDESVGADQVLARASRAHGGDWQRARVAFERSALGHLVFSLWLHHVGLTAQDVQVVFLSPPEQLKAWQEAAIDVAISYPPHAQALQALGAVPVYGSDRFPGMVLDVLAVLRPRLGWRDRRQVQALVQGHFRGLEHLRLSSEDALRRMALRQGITYAAAQASLRGLNLPEVTANLDLLRPDGALLGAAQRLSQVMVAAQLLPRPDSLTDLVEAQFLADVRRSG